MPHDPYKSLYIHIPYCKKRCSYCDFATDAVGCDNPLISQYVEDIILEVRRACTSGELADIKTIYIGGGTPTHIGNKRLSSLFYMLSTSINLDEVEEYTIEANPESLTEAIVKDGFAMGVNRLSIGVQSFDDDVLQILGRIHDSKKARMAIEIAQKRFENVSIDLMCGIPGQSIESFQRSLEIAIESGITHISIYPLSIERNTAMYKMELRGEIAPIDEDEQARHMEFASDILQNAGFDRYEVASYSKPGFESKHNLSYWRGIPYLGIGASATTMTQNSERRMRITDGQVEDDLNPVQMVAEDCMLAMRTKFGIDSDLYGKATNLLPTFPKILEELLELGLVEHKNNAYIPTEKGWLLGNEMYRRIIELAQFPFL